jgi:hypothetical protein
MAIRPSLPLNQVLPLTADFPQVLDFLDLVLVVFELYVRC